MKDHLKGMPATLEDIYAPVASMLDRVEGELVAIGEKAKERLSQVHSYLFDRGGKRLRPALVIFGASLGKPIVPEQDKTLDVKVVALAMATELIHTATLVHDDIIDNAVVRRKKPAAHVKFGDDVAILMGDFLYSYGFTFIAPLENPLVLDLLARSTRIMSEGELNQLAHRFDFELPLEDYLSFIEAKTAGLIAASACAGARLAQASKEVESAMREYGLNLGMAFQMTDDLLDLVGDEYSVGKTLRTDISNGKITLPLILLREQLPPQERKIFLNLLREPESGWSRIRAMMAESRVMAKSYEVASGYTQSAIRALDAVGDHPFKKNLISLAEFVLERKH